MLMEQRANQYPHNLRVLSVEIYESAKKWLVASMICRFGTFAIGILAVLSANFSQASPFLVALCSLCAEYCLWKSDGHRRLAEDLRRKTDMEDSLGWRISAGEMRDVLARIPNNIRDLAESESSTEPYFASLEETGPVRMLENLRESAWWSKHLSEKTAKLYLWIMTGLFAISLTVLIVSIQTIRNFDILSNIGRAITSTIMLVFSLSLLRTTVGYFRFSQKSERLQEVAELLLQDNKVDLIQAIKATK